MSTHNIFVLQRNENICCGPSLEMPRCTSNDYPQHNVFVEKKEKYQQFWTEK